jgi:hypothetical protein
MEKQKVNREKATEFVSSQMVRQRKERIEY